MEVIVLGALVFGIAYAFTHRGSNRTATDDWQPAQPRSVPARGSDTRHVGSRAQHAAGVQLARVEGRQLMRNEVFIVGIFMSIAILVIFGLVWASDNLGANNSWRYWLALLPVFTLPFAGMTLVAMNLAALRARREGTEELFGSLPATSTTRVIGHLGSVWMALVVQIVFVAATFASGRLLTNHFGAIDVASIGDIMVSFVLVVCAGSLAVALRVGSPIPWSRSSQWWCWRSEGPPSGASAATTGALPVSCRSGRATPIMTGPSRFARAGGTPPICSPSHSWSRLSRWPGSDTTGSRCSSVSERSLLPA